MDVESQEPEERTDLEKDQEAWNLPPSPFALAVPPHDNWPELDRAFEEGLSDMDGPPLTAA